MLQEIILQYFSYSLSHHLWLRPLYCIFVSGRSRQVLPYSCFENREYVFKCTFTLFLQENLICGQEFARANANMILMGGVLVGALAIGILADM